MEVMINKDIRKFKAKDIGNFTFKEAGFIAGAGLLAVINYKLCSDVFDTVSYELIMLPSIVILIFGFLKPYGLTLRQFMSTIFIEKFVQPQTLKWESDFKLDEPTMEELESLYGEEYDLSNLYLIEEEEDSNNKKKDKKKKKN